MVNSAISPISKRLAAEVSLRSNKLYFLTLLLSLIPLWLPRYLPLIDISQHAAQITALRSILHGDEFFTSAFEVNWFTPYLLGYLLLYALASVVPVTVAVKIVVSGAVLAFPLSVAVLLREFEIDERLKWCAIPASYSFAFYWGFLSYMVAVPLALYLLVLTVRWDRHPSGTTAARIALFSIVLFFSHLIALCFGSLLALCFLLGKHYADPKAMALRALPYTTPLPLILYWLFNTYQSETLTQDAPVYGASLLVRGLVLVMGFGGFDGFALLIGLWVAGVMLMLPARLGLTLSRRPERWLPLCVALAVYVLCPHGAFNTLFLFHRLAVFLVPLWLIAWERPPDRPATPTRKPLVVILLLTISVWLSLNLTRFGAFAEDTRGLTAVMSRMEPEKYAAGMTGFTGTREFFFPVYLHIAAWYQATRGGIVDFNFAIFHPQLVRYKDMTSPRIDVPRSERPKTFVWDRDGGDRYDYFLVYSEEDVAAELFKDRIDEVELATRDGSWWVYRNLKRWPEPSSASRRPVQDRRERKEQSF